MNTTEFIRRANEFLDSFNQALHHHAPLPAEPDLEGFVPRTAEDFSMLEKVISQCQKLQSQAEDARNRAHQALTAPRLVRRESIDAGTTLFSEA